MLIVAMVLGIAFFSIIVIGCDAMVNKLYSKGKRLNSWLIGICAFLIVIIPALFHASSWILQSSYALFAIMLFFYFFVVTKNMKNRVESKNTQKLKKAVDDVKKLNEKK